jgi:hypothetical protein
VRRVCVSARHLPKTIWQISDGKAGETAQKRGHKTEAPGLSFSLFPGWNVDPQIARPGFEK